MTTCSSCNAKLPQRSSYLTSNEKDTITCNNCKQQSELKRRLVCSICDIQLTSKEVIACGISSERLRNYFSYRCYRSTISDPDFVSEYFGILTCATHSCICMPRSQPNGNIKPCDICKSKMVCRECEYRRCKNGILYTSMCKPCYDK
jgi:hypothetical protein